MLVGAAGWCCANVRGILPPWWCRRGSQQAPERDSRADGPGHPAQDPHLGGVVYIQVAGQLAGLAGAAQRDARHEGRVARHASAACRACKWCHSLACARLHHRRSAPAPAAADGGERVAGVYARQFHHTLCTPRGLHECGSGSERSGAVGGAVPRTAAARRPPATSLTQAPDLPPSVQPARSQVGEGSGAGSADPGAGARAL